MKPVRASSRVSTSVPSRKRKNPPQDAGCSGRTKVSSRAGHAGTRDVKGQKNWKPLPKAFIAALENMLGLSILSALTIRRKDKEECQQHLNLLKDRFLAECARLLVPPPKLSHLTLISRLYQQESQKESVGQKAHQALEEELSAVVGALEKMEGRMDALEQENRSLRAQLEKAEESSQQVLQTAEQGVLHLPPSTSQELPLQERMAKMVLDADLASCLGGALQSSVEVQEMLAFLEAGHHQADQLLWSLAHR